MTVNRLGDDRVLITLCHKDMDDFLLDFKSMSLSDNHSRRVLMRIMQVACRRSGISVSGKSVNVEAMQFGDGCYLLVTVAGSRRGHAYRVKNSSLSFCYNAGSLDNLLDIIERLYKMNIMCSKNAVFEYNGEYYLIFDNYIPKQFRGVLSEFAKRKGGGITAARIREYGTAVCARNAVSHIGKHLI